MLNTSANLSGNTLLTRENNYTITGVYTFGNDLLFTDALYDIGKSGATRPRDGFFSRDVVVGRNLTPGTVVADLLFTDATYDIGKSLATRPRDGFFSRNVTIGGAVTLSSTLAVSSTGSFAGILTLTSTFTQSLSTNAASGGSLTNASTGTSAATTLVFANNGTQVSRLQLFGGNRTTYANFVANAFGLYTDSTAGLAFLVDAAGPITFGTGATATERVRIDSVGNVGLGVTSFGTAAVGVLGIVNGTAPTSSPAGMGQLYVVSGALTYRGSSGTVTTVALA